MPLSKARMRERKRLDRLDVKPKQIQHIPKYDIGYLYPDGRVRLEDMRLVKPNQCLVVKMWK